MASKSKEVRVRQREALEKKLALRLEKLSASGINEKASQKDALVKNLKSKIKETNQRIAAFDKNVKLTADLAQAKAEKKAQKASADAPEAKPKKTAKKAADKGDKKAAGAGEGQTKKAAKKKD